MLEELLKAIHATGTIMNERELYELMTAYGAYERVPIIYEENGQEYIVDYEYQINKKALQELADDYTENFDVLNY